MPGIASAATAVAMAIVGARHLDASASAPAASCCPTTRRWSSPSSSARWTALYPGRIDLGLGRAPGTDQAAARALRRNLRGRRRPVPAGRRRADGLFRRPQTRPACAPCPATGCEVPIWILGSSLFGAQLAAMLGLPYAFASHFAPQMMMEAIERLPRAVPAVGAAGQAVRDARLQRVRRRHRRGGAAARDLAAAGVRRTAHRPADAAAAAPARAMPTSLPLQARGMLDEVLSLLGDRPPGDRARAD